MNRILQNKKYVLYGAIISGALYVLSQAVIMKILEPLGVPSVFRFQLSFTAGGLNALLASWGDAGIETFKRHFYLDFLHPFWYGAFLFFLMLLTRSRQPGWKKGAIPKYFYLPIIAAIFDLAENVCEIALLRQRPDLNDALVFLTASCSLIKWSLVAVSILIISIFVLRIVIGRLRMPGR